MHLRSFRFFALLALCGSFAGAAVVHKTDDTTVTGDLQSIIAGKLTVIDKNTPTVLSLEDIGQITLKEPPAPVAPKTPEPVVQNNDADDGPNLGAALFGALFSGPHTQSHVETNEVIKPAPVVTSQPAMQPVATTQPFVAPTGQFTLTDGDQFHARLQQWTDQKLKLDLTVGPSIELSSSSITQIWLGTQDLQNKAKSLAIDPGAEDIAFVSKNDDIVTVKGLILGITNDSLQFRYGDQDRKINLNKVVGLLLRSNATTPLPGFHQLIHTDSGDRFSGTLSAIDHDSIVLSTADAPVKILISTITHIDFINGKVTSLCDLKPTRVEQAAYFGRVMNYQIDKSLTGGLLDLSDGPVKRGIAVHSRCVLQYDLPQGIDRFKTKLGFAQPEGLQGRVKARVLADGKPLYENPDARGDQPPIEIDVPLTGAHTLTLEIDFGKDQDVGDRVVWANPRLLRGK